MKRKLFSRKLEKVSREIFERYSQELSKLVGTSHGVYALYDEHKLYYIGKASNLKRRIRSHLRDRHFAQWTHSSLFLTNKSVYIDDIESVIISAANPKGNRVKPKGNVDILLKKEPKSLVQSRQEEEISRLFGGKSRRKRRSKIKRGIAARSILKGLFKHSKLLVREYKGKEYRAKLLSSGKIKCKNKLYNSPTPAALAAVNKKSFKRVNGWTF